MSEDGDSARKRVFHSTENVLRQRALIRELRAAGRDAGEAESQLIEHEVQYTTSVDEWRRVRGW